MIKTNLGYTYNEWRLQGYHVIKGEKATGRNQHGKATFTLEQVEEDDYHEFDNWEYEDDWIWHDPDMGDR